MEKEIMEKEKMSFYRLGKMPENKPAVRRVFEALVEFLNTAINTHFPEVKKEELDENGAVVYKNANDGTGFDWDMNERTCEIMAFYNEGRKMGFYKVWLDRKGNLSGYIYGDNGYGEPKEIAPHKACTPQEARRFADYLYDNYDDIDAWDEEMSEIEVAV